MLISRSGRFAVLFAGLFLAFSMVAVDHADARRGGSFGSRGMRTFQPVPPTRTAPQPAAPVERSMTPNAATNNAARQPQAFQYSSRADVPGLDVSQEFCSGFSLPLEGQRAPSALFFPPTRVEVTLYHRLQPGPDNQHRTARLFAFPVSCNPIDDLLPGCSPPPLDAQAGRLFDSLPLLVYVRPSRMFNA
ncbi:hypothetical protein NKJ22_23750 [Mesorhizobium sp. M0220]